MTTEEYMATRADVQAVEVAIRQLPADLAIERRERIAALVLSGFAAHGWVDPDIMAERAVQAADSLIAELDK